MKNFDRRQSLRGPHFPQTLPEVSLEITRGTAQRRMRVVKPPVYLIGQAADCDLVLGDRQFPPIHTYLYVTESGVSLRHIGEGPELRVNGNAVEVARVVDQDHLQLGDYEFKLHVRQRKTDDDSTTETTSVQTPSWEQEYDPEWQHLQVLLCELPAPLRPLSRQVEPAAKLAIYHHRVSA